MHYIILSIQISDTSIHYITDLLQKQVNKKIVDGYKPLGGISITNKSASQAMIKE